MSSALDMVHLGWYIKWLFSNLIHLSMDHTGLILGTIMVMMLVLPFTGLLVYLAEHRKRVC